MTDDCQIRRCWVIKPVVLPSAEAVLRGSISPGYVHAPRVDVQVTERFERGHRRRGLPVRDRANFQATNAECGVAWPHSRGAAARDGEPHRARVGVWGAGNRSPAPCELLRVGRTRTTVGGRCLYILDSNACWRITTRSGRGQIQRDPGARFIKSRHSTSGTRFRRTETPPRCTRLAAAVL